jgi:2-methylisocitrate lyase-like PEP mutase family enzyme
MSAARAISSISASAPSPAPARDSPGARDARTTASRSRACWRTSSRSQAPYQSPWLPTSRTIEDSTRDNPEPLYDLPLAIDRIRAAREAIDRSGTGALLTARCESYLVGRPDLAATIKRLKAYADAGADCLFAPGLATREDVDAVVKAVAPKPVNLIVVSPWITLAEAQALGVRRISVGGALARAAWGGFHNAASEILSKGTFGSFAGQRLDLDRIFG